MAALMREILEDIVQNKVVRHDTDRLVESGHSIAWEYLPGWEDQCIAQCDVSVALKHLVVTAQVDRRDIIALQQFMSGKSISEIALPDARERLVRVLALLEETTRYTDERFLERVITKYPKYRKTKDAYLQRLQEHGREFQ